MTDRGLISNIYKQFIQLNIKKTNNPIKKWAEEPNRHFLQRGNADGQQAQEKMLNIANHQGNASRNHNERSSHTCENGHHQKNTNNKCWQGCGEKRALIHCWWEFKLMQPPWKAVWRFHKRPKIELHYDPAIPPLGIYLKKPETLI